VEWRINSWDPYALFDSTWLYWNIEVSLVHFFTNLSEVSPSFYCHELYE
jgi:hypothetical protein